jgi:hypothetical protein
VGELPAGLFPFEEKPDYLAGQKEPLQSVVSPMWAENVFKKAPFWWPTRN